MRDEKNKIIRGAYQLGKPDRSARPLLLPPAVPCPSLEVIPATVEVDASEIDVGDLSNTSGLIKSDISSGSGSQSVSFMFAMGYQQKKTVNF